MKLVIQKWGVALLLTAYSLIAAQAGSPSSSKVDSLYQRVLAIADENPQEASRLANLCRQESSKSGNSRDKALSLMANAQALIAMSLWNNASEKIDSASLFVQKLNDLNLEADLVDLRSNLEVKVSGSDAALKMLQKAYSQAIKSKRPDLGVKFLLLQAGLYQQKGNLAEANRMREIALDQSSKAGCKKCQAECQQNIASSYWQQGRFNEALESYFKSLILFEDINDTIGMLAALKGVGISYRDLGQFEKSLTYLNRALKLSDSSNNYTEEAAILNIIGSLYFKFNQVDDALKQYEQSLQIREKLGLLRSAISTHSNMARAYLQKSMYKQAIEHLNEALALQEQVVDPLAEASTLTEIGNLNLQQGNIAEALRHYLMALKLRQTYGQDEDIAKSLTSIGLTYRRLGMYKSALKYLEQAREIIQDMKGSMNDAAYILQNLGHIYLDLNSPDKAIATYKEALTLKEKSGDSIGAAKILKNIAQAQLKSSQPDQARTSISQALKLVTRTHSTSDIADLYNELGNVERQAKNPGMAIKHYHTAIENYKALNNNEGVALCLRKIGEIQVGQKQLDEARKNINSSIEIGKQSGNKYLLSYGYLAQSELYRAQGLFDKALESYIKHIGIRDSLESVKRNEANLEAQIDLELDQTKTEIKVMEAEVEALRQKTALDKAIIEKQRLFRNSLIAIILLVVTAASIAFYSLIQKRRYAKLLEEKIEEIRLVNERLNQSESELRQTIKTKDKLFSIIAHDLRSPFTALVGLSEVMATNLESLSPDEIREFSHHIHRSATEVLNLTENLLSWARSQTGKIELSPKPINLKDLTNQVFSVAAIPAQEKKIKLRESIPANLTVFADFDTLQTVIRNLVSNAIKFTPQGGSIGISAKNSSNSMVEIAITDTGVGIDPENQAKLFRVDGFTTKGTNQENGTGLGLILCKEFVELNHGTIEVSSTPGLGTTFTISLPSNN